MVLISARLVRFMNVSDSFYFTISTDCADYNYFTDFVKTKNAGNFPANIKFSITGQKTVFCTENFSTKRILGIVMGQIQSEKSGGIKDKE